jgi:hypothetical protein
MSLKVQICTLIPNEDGPKGPRRGRLCFEWVKARLDLLHPLTTTVISRWEVGMSIDDGRNSAAQGSLDDNCDFLFFLDWDTIPHPQALHQLVMRALNNPDYDVFSGVYCCRHRDYPAPLVYTTDEFKLSYDWTVGDVLTSEEHDITGFGMGLALIRTSLFTRLKASNPELPFFKTTPSEHVNCGETEDLYFLKRAKKEVGAKFLIDTSLQAWHQDPETGVGTNLPHDCLPIKRWREQDGIPENALPYPGLFPAYLTCIGQKMTDCSLDEENSDG